MSNRDEIRKALLGAKSEFKKQVVEWNGIKVEIRQPSVRGRKAIIERCTHDGELKSMDFVVWSVIENTYVEGTDERVFEPTDFDELETKPTGGFIDKFGEVATDLMNVAGDVKEKIKN